MHAGVNALPVVLSEDVVVIPGFNTDDTTSPDPRLVLASGLLAAVAFALALRASPTRSTADQRSG
jgi:hypothetical protein